ncbi:leucyl aminopeptidase family protein [Paraferrimonas sedimenticola]|uniref:Leucyl aminopeptidase n=1 Tax=Paraferrimonas sedimenticola TaxID=375674 RepID=A0AA37W1Y6_9GAMM|nr:leucyl aminopeptidase family protein [Paraferrimonas sedimenticola]GLP97047.1 leucyl aminopeptidase [Paraferrimonas sedimenticola]
MSAVLAQGSQGIPLVVLDKASFDAWLEQQELRIANWLTNTGFAGVGLSLIPAADGSVETALFVAEDAQEYFACGDLIHLLPVGDYQLQTQAQNQLAVAFGWAVGSYRFERYLKPGKTLPRLSIENMAVVEEAQKLTQATALVRDLVNTPAGDMMPEHLAKASKALAEEFGAEFSEVVGDELLEQNFPTIHAVGRASIHAPRLIDFRWGDANAPKLTLVGKGVCFDSGGLDIKPAAGMRNMKKDMGGAAHVLGLARLIMASNLKVNLRVLIPAVENAIAGNAYRPGDVITTRKGLTVEIHNTDAEGRLVMCDALDLAAEESPELVIDFATLTGAMRVALGTELPGFFATKPETALGLIQAGEPVQDPVWQMPLYKGYHSLMKSDIADMTNCPNAPFGGAITAALYLQEFLPKGTDWVHFDIMAFNVRKLPGRPLGGEAFGVRATFDYLKGRFGVS